MGKVGTCALCLADGVGLKHSHIIPEFKFTWTYDEKHQLKPIVHNKRKPEPSIQKGWREYLLCEGCEQKIGKWEDHAARVTRKCHRTMIENPTHIFFDLDVDFEKMWKFALSVLWRMAVCSGDFFAHVRIVKDVEPIRRILLGEDFQEKNDYSLILVGIKVMGAFDQSIISTCGTESLDEGFRYHHFLLAGLHYTIAVRTSPDATPDRIILPGKYEIMTAFLFPESAEMKVIHPNREGCVRVFVIAAEEMPYLHEQFLKVAQFVRGEGSEDPPRD